MSAENDLQRAFTIWTAYADGEGQILGSVGLRLTGVPRNKFDRGVKPPKGPHERWTAFAGNWEATGPTIADAAEALVGVARAAVNDYHHARLDQLRGEVRKHEEALKALGGG